RLLGLGRGGADALVEDHRPDQVVEQRLAVAGIPAQLAAGIGVAGHRGLLTASGRAPGPWAAWAASSPASFPGQAPSRRGFPRSSAARSGPAPRSRRS